MSPLLFFSFLSVDFKIAQYPYGVGLNEAKMSNAHAALAVYLQKVETMIDSFSFLLSWFEKGAIGETRRMARD